MTARPYVEVLVAGAGWRPLWRPATGEEIALAASSPLREFVREMGGGPVRYRVVG